MAENVAFGLSDLDIDAGERDARVQAHLHLVRLSGFERAYPHQLSGGMAQRVALARALVNRPELLLLDEPFGAIGALTRAEMQDELLRVRAGERFTALLVTHDIEESAYLADRVIVMLPRPARIAAICDIALAHPRDRNGAAFAGARAEIAGLLARARCTVRQGFAVRGSSLTWSSQRRIQGDARCVIGCLLRAVRFTLVRVGTRVVRRR